MPVVVYTLLRAAVFLAATGLLWWAGMRSWLAPAVAALVAWAVSYVAFGRQRDAATRHLAERAEQRAGGRPQSRAEQDAAAEDAATAAAEPAAPRDPAAG